MEDMAIVAVAERHIVRQYINCCAGFWLLSL